MTHWDVGMFPGFIPAPEPAVYLGTAEQLPQVVQAFGPAQNSSDVAQSDKTNPEEPVLKTEPSDSSDKSTQRDQGEKCVVQFLAEPGESSNHTTPIKTLATWQEIPLELKLKFVQYLNHFSRQNLRSCSKHDRDIIDSTPFVIASFVIKSDGIPNFIVHSTLPKKLSIRYVPLRQITKAFSKAMQVPMVRIERLEVCQYVVPLLTAALDAMGPSQVVKTDLVHLQGSNRFTGVDTIIPFLSRLVGVKHILLDGNFYENIFEGLVALEQWKKASGIAFHDMNQLPIEPFLHLNSFKIFLYRISTEDAKRIIQTYLDKTSFHPRTTFFKITTERPMKPERILTEKSEQLKMELKDPRDYSTNAEAETRCWKFRKSEEFLVVKSSRKTLKGAICRPDYINEDFNESPLI